MTAAAPRQRGSVPVQSTPSREELLTRVEAVVHRLDRAVERRRGALRSVHPSHLADAVNLLHYLALRQSDARDLQRALLEQGLSSLGRCEPHVRATLSAVRDALAGDPGWIRERPDFQEGRAALDHNTDALLGPRPAGRVTRIMVTLPSEAATDPAVVGDLVRRGMDVARVNAAHDEPDAWRAMVANVRAAAADTGRPVLVSVDLPGPKMRTGPLEPGPAVVRLSPRRDERGTVVVPAVNRLVPDDGGAGLPVDAAWLSRRRPGDELEVQDARGGLRRLTVIAADDQGAVVEARRTAYVETGAALTAGSDTTTVGPLPVVERAHRLRPGDALVLTPDLAPVPAWRPGSPGHARIGCTLPELFDVVRPGHRVLLDDGRLGAVVESAEPTGCMLRITSARATGTRLRGGKGINLPDTELTVPILAPADDVALQVAAEVADLVALSFLRTADDVDAVLRRLQQLRRPDLGLLLKVENRSAFEHLPAILLRGLRAPRVGVMIARGDLAVELGYERLAEVQEELLWLCEAARLPVVWATQVLDNLARTGQPSRAEVTDAAMAQRAECVMLNKGPHIAAAIEVLDDILRRMAGHQRKKTALLRPLASWSS